MSSNIESDKEQIREEFLSFTGISSVNMSVDYAGLEEFLFFNVERDAPLYRLAVSHINETLSPENQFRGRIIIKKTELLTPVLESSEIELLQSTITRSLRITGEHTSKAPIIDFVPFRNHEENRIVQTANHGVTGRRGVGKSTLLLITFWKIFSFKKIPVWIDLQAFSGRRDANLVLEILRDILARIKDVVTVLNVSDKKIFLKMNEISKILNVKKNLKFKNLPKFVPLLKNKFFELKKEMRKDVYIFLDDAHYLDNALQPQIFNFIYSVFKGGGGWLKISGVKNLLRLYDPPTRTGLQSPNDIQLLSLDLTLVDPLAAKEHLVAVLNQFLSPCGLSIKELIHDRAVERLVWCSAGVPRDFLWLFEKSLSSARSNHRKKIGLQEINYAVGEFGQEKMTELEQDSSEEAIRLKQALENLQEEVLDNFKSNSFLVPLDPKHMGYKILLKLVDLRLVHLIHPSITLRSAGERYEAYLLDYSFYTGVRRRQGLSELKIGSDQTPKYSLLRKLKKIDLNIFLKNVTN